MPNLDKRKLGWLLSIGITLSLLLKEDGLSYTSPTFLSDTFFACALVCLVVACGQQVSNIGLFNNLAFGSKTLYRLMQNRLGKSEDIKDEYLEYLKSRKSYTDNFIILGYCLVFYILSVAVYR